MLILILPIILTKSFEQNKVMRNKPKLDKEDPLPENFQMHAKSYAQIKRTAFLISSLEAFAFLSSLYFWYLVSFAKLYINTIYLGFTALAIFFFIGIIYDYKLYKKTHKEEPPTKHFLRNLNIMQLVSFSLFALSYLLLSVI